MLAAETKAAEAAHLPASHEPSHGTWKHIVEPVEPFLRAVADGLEEQVQAFDPGIATYARYARRRQSPARHRGGGHRDGPSGHARA
jgi:hypothetical protein